MKDKCSIARDLMPLVIDGVCSEESSSFVKEHISQMQEYIGLGAGAHGFIDNIRYSNVSLIEDYINDLSKNNLPIDVKEKVSKEELFEETIMLGLRTRFGIDLLDIKQKFGKDLLKEKNDVINELLGNNLITLENNHIIATDLGFTVLNKLIIDLI